MVRKMLILVVLSIITLTYFPVNCVDACEDVPQINLNDESEMYFGQDSYVYIYFDPNGGTCSTRYVKVKLGESVTLPSAERSGYNFKQWVNSNGALLMSSSGVPYYNDAGDVVSPKETVTLYATWEKKTILNSLSLIAIAILLIAVTVIYFIYKLLH